MDLLELHKLVLELLEVDFLIDPLGLLYLLVTVCVGVNKELLRKHYDKVVRRIKNPTPFHLPDGKQAQKKYECRSRSV